MHDFRATLSQLTIDLCFVDSVDERNTSESHRQVCIKSHRLISIHHVLDLSRRDVGLVNERRVQLDGRLLIKNLLDLILDSN